MYENEIEKIKNEYGLGDIVVIEAALSLDKSCSCKYGGVGFIGIDSDRVGSVAELRSLILHEAGHIREGAFYALGAASIERKKAERLAIAWAVKNCIPFEQYLDAIRDGVRDVYQLAERFNITVESARKTVEYYSGRLLEYISLAMVGGHAL